MYFITKLSQGERKEKSLVNSFDWELRLLYEFEWNFKITNKPTKPTKNNKITNFTIIC